MLGFNKFLRDEDAVGVVEMILIIVVLIGVVILFRDRIKALVNSIFTTINSDVRKV